MSPIGNVVEIETDSTNLSTLLIRFLLEDVRITDALHTYKQAQVNAKATIVDAVYRTLQLNSRPNTDVDAMIEELVSLVEGVWKTWK